MPAVSVDTFFACSLMVMLVLSAMAATTTVLRPHINNAAEGIPERYREISKYLLLNEGKPSNWGQNGQTVPQTFGLAKPFVKSAYELDMDKVSRLNSENVYAISYADAYASLKMPDVSFKMEIKPLFEVSISLVATFKLDNDTVYKFRISTERNGSPVPTQLRMLTVAEDYLDAISVSAASGEKLQNITISDSVTGPALLVVLARSSYNDKIASFNAFAFAHNSAEPDPKGTFLRLSPLDYGLNASFLTSGISLTQAYALTFDYDSPLVQMANTSESVTYEIPHFLDSAPTVLVVTGLDTLTFFSEWTAYPQMPIDMGADFADSHTLSDVFSFTYLVTVDSAIYDCAIWLGGPKK